jgi:adenosine deaminase
LGPPNSPSPARDTIARPSPRRSALIDTAALRDLPKVELHVHLEGTITAGTAVELAVRNGLDPDRIPGMEGRRYPARFRDFDHFVELYIGVSAAVRTPDDLATVATAFARHQAEQNVRYSEATFTATTHVNNGMEATAMWEAITAGFAEVPETDVALIVDAVRNYGPENADQTIRLVAEADAPIVAFGLAGIETARPIEEFAHLRSAADRLGIGLVVHAGETGPPDEVLRAVDLGADRIGHGVAAASDPRVLERVVRGGVVLEVCPTSNVVIGVIADHASHPFASLWKAGANVTVNSDDPPFFGTTLTDEIAFADRAAGLGVDGVATLQRRAAEAAFLSSERRAAILREIDDWAAATGG